MLSTLITGRAVVRVGGGRREVDRAPLSRANTDAMSAGDVDGDMILRPALRSCTATRFLLFDCFRALGVEAVERSACENSADEYIESWGDYAFGMRHAGMEDDDKHIGPIYMVEADGADGSGVRQRFWGLASRLRARRFAWHDDVLPQVSVEELTRGGPSYGGDALERRWVFTFRFTSKRRRSACTSSTRGTSIPWHRASSSRNSCTSRAWPNPSLCMACCSQREFIRHQSREQDLTQRMFIQDELRERFPDQAMAPTVDR